MRRPVVLTRDPERNAELAAALRAGGHDVLELPCVRTLPAADVGVLRDALAALTSRDLLVVTSRAGADAVLAAADHPVPARIATVGARAAAALLDSGMAVDHVAPTGAALAREVALPQGEVVLARSDRALADLPDILRSRGGRVREVVAYRTVARAVGDEARAAALLADGAAVVVASPSALDALLGAVGPGALARARIIATGPTTAEHVRARTGRDATLAPWGSVAEVLS